jgi:DNA-binding CsgD family transcriptional regulator
MSAVRGGGPFDAAEAKVLARVEQALLQLPTGSEAVGLFDAIAQVVPAAAGTISTIDPAAPEAMATHPIRLPDEVFETWMRTPPVQLTSLLAPILQSQDGDLVHDYEGIPAPLRGSLEVLGTFDAHGLGESAGYKVLTRAVPGQGVEQVMLALIAERKGHFPLRSRQLLAALNPAIGAAVERLRVPLLPSRSIFAQVIAEQRLGYVCLSMTGSIVEANRRAHDLALCYQRVAGLQGRRHALRELASLARLKAGAGRPWLLPDGTGESILELSAHRLAAQTHQLAEDVLLLMMKEMRLKPYPDDPFVAERLARLTPRQREVVDLLVTTGLPVKGIAERLGVSEATARKHAENIYRLLGVHSRAELAEWMKGPSGG